MSSSMLTRAMPASPPSFSMRSSNWNWACVAVSPLEAKRERLSPSSALTAAASPARRGQASKNRDQS